MTQLVLIGTGATLAALEPAVRALGPAHHALGGVLLSDEPTLARNVLGTLDELPALAAANHIDTALVCLPAAMTEAQSRVRRVLRALGITMKTTPFVGDALTGEAAAPSLADLHTLTGRPPRQADPALLDAVLAGKRVLITGAGGSIGSELARLAASRGPAELVLMERAENALFEIDQEIGAQFPGVPRRAIMHDVVDAAGTLRHFQSCRPHTVFHAAAHKHVPMMEDHPAHAVNNNLFGTKAAADVAMQARAERFVLISTDKAVNPSSVMGATKRLAEHYVRGMGQLGGTRYSMVRFGNVLGSNGSVLTVWRRQIAAGGPVTVTHPDMTRFFMTIPEAASLVVQASALAPAQAGGAGVFVLDMGEPVRVMDLAERAIRASGHAPVREAEGAEPGTIAISVTGTRPGEKIHEELAHRSESLQNTSVEGVMAWSSPPIVPLELHTMTLELGRVRFEPDAQKVVETLRRWTPTLGQAAQPEIVVRDLAARVC